MIVRSWYGILPYPFQPSTSIRTCVSGTDRFIFHETILRRYRYLDNFQQDIVLDASGGPETRDALRPLRTICCGFGTVILLLVLSRIYEPAMFETTERNLKELIAILQEELFEIHGEATVVSRELASARQITTNTKMSLTGLQQELSSVQGQYQLLIHDAPELQIDEGELRAALQRLTEQMARLQPNFRRAADDAVGGIPVDSEYIVFVIDTSGSMHAKWDFIIEKLEEVFERLSDSARPADHERQTGPSCFRGTDNAGWKTRRRFARQSETPCVNGHRSTTATRPMVSSMLSRRSPTTQRRSAFTFSGTILPGVPRKP
jgi:hypothetical protein